jgi:hypothetical protein
MVGAETSRIVLCIHKGKNDRDRINIIYPGHYGPIYSIQRYPFFNKIFLLVGDWTLQIWSEEIHDDYNFFRSKKSDRKLLRFSKHTSTYLSKYTGAIKRDYSYLPCNYPAQLYVLFSSIYTVAFDSMQKKT